MTPLFAIGQLRHAFKQLCDGTVVRQREFATGLLGPAIACLEAAFTPPPPEPQPGLDCAHRVEIETDPPKCADCGATLPPPEPQPGPAWCRRPGRECGCGSAPGWHLPGTRHDCEYYTHHCESCHAKGICTAAECKSEPQPGPLDSDRTAYRSEAAAVGVPETQPGPVTDWCPGCGVCHCGLEIEKHTHLDNHAASPMCAHEPPPAPRPAVYVDAIMAAISESIEIGCESGEGHEKILRRVRDDLDALRKAGNGNG